MSRILNIALALIVVLCGAQAHAQPVSMDLAYDHVDITTAFTGSSVVVFGTKAPRGSLAIIVEGPRKDLVVRKKESVFGAWLNRSWIRFENVPQYYDYALEVSKIGIEKPFGGFAVGDEALVFMPKGDKYPEGKREEFQNALIKEKQRLGLYPIAPSKVEFIDQSLFRVQFEMPSNVPKGEYTVRGVLLERGVPVSEVQKTFKIAQVGFSFGVFRFAQNRAFLYGLGCVFMALLAGWVSNKITN